MPSITRRTILAAAASLPWAAADAAETTIRTPVALKAPPGSCDCHVHVFPDPAAFPFWTGRAYSPPIATAEDLLDLQRGLGLDRVVIIQPSVYGTDNRATLDGVRQLGPQRARGIAVIDDGTTPAELDHFAAAGIVGVRVNFETAGQTDPAVAAKRLAATAAQIAGRPWHIQIYSRLSVIAPLHDQFAALPIPVVFDHFAGAQGLLGPDQPGFGSVLDLVRSGRAYVKLSGAYRSSTAAPDYGDVTPLARALVRANPDRLIWGTDWPHPDSATVPGRKPTDLAPAQRIDDGRVLNLLADWVPDEAIRNRILVDNPAQLYGF